MGVREEVATQLTGPGGPFEIVTETINVFPETPQGQAAIDAEIRGALGKPTGQLTKADLEKISRCPFWRFTSAA